MFVRTLEEDLKRRDFTMNAIAYDPLADALVDPYGGRRDLEARTIRAVGEPRERFLEDGLRAMRAVRFAAQLEFAHRPGRPSAPSPSALDVFRKVSAERVRDELEKILMARAALGWASSSCARRACSALVIPELLESVGMHQNRFHKHDVWHHTLAAVDATELGGAPPWLVRLAALLHDVAKPRTAAPKEDAPAENTFYRHEHVGADMADAICRRLKLANAERETVVNLVGNHMFWYTPEWSDGTVRRFISRVGVEHLDALFALRAGDVRARGQGEEPGVEVDELRARVRDEIAKASALKITDLAVGGADVMEMLGCRPGPIIGEVLRRAARARARRRLAQPARHLARNDPRGGAQAVGPSSRERRRRDHHRQRRRRRALQARPGAAGAARSHRGRGDRAGGRRASPRRRGA